MKWRFSLCGVSATLPNISEVGLIETDRRVDGADGPEQAKGPSIDVQSDGWRKRRRRFGQIMTPSGLTVSMVRMMLALLEQFERHRSARAPQCRGGRGGKVKVHCGDGRRPPIAFSSRRQTGAIPW
jgi:hypothetical protein